MGALEYHFAFPHEDAMEIEWLEISFEACSEAPMYRDPWKSDISVSVNGKPLGVWTSPCDCGGRRGKLTLEWCSGLSTQYGFLKTWHVDEDGSYLENARVCDTTLQDLNLLANPYIMCASRYPRTRSMSAGSTCLANASATMRSR